MGLILALSAVAQESARPAGPTVSVAPIAPVIVRKGKPSEFEINFRVAPGYHINSNKPKSALLVPTALKFDPPTDILIGKVTYPPGKDQKFAFMPDEPLNVYTGDFSVTGLVSTSRSIPFGTYRVRAAMKYQACDNRQCFPPKQVPLEFDVKVKKLDSRSTRRNPGQSPHVHR